MTYRMNFGVFIPQGWKMELSSIADPVDKWDKAVEVAELAEQLGLDSLWVYDHVHNVPVPAHEAVFECWTTLAAISQRTSRIRLGQMVGCASYRTPALLAKITSTLDVISGGRLDWGIGAGWYDQEYRAYGYDYPSNRDRIRGLRETVEIVKQMWTEPDATYAGEIYSVDGAQCDPKPLQHPHPPILIGGGGEQLTLRVVARLANRSNFGGKPHEWAHKCEVLKGHCAEVGRDVKPRPSRRGWISVVLGRTVRLVAGGEPRRYRRAGVREDPDLSRYGLHRVLALVLRLSRHRNGPPAGREGGAPVPLGVLVVGCPHRWPGLVAKSIPVG